MLPLFLACTAPPPASQAFSDAARATFARFEDEDEASLAEPVLMLLDQIATELDMSGSSVDRALTPETLQEEDLVDIPVHPDRDPGLAIPVAVAFDSAYGPDDHSRIVLLSDQTPVEPNSPDQYTRTFTEGGGCFWEDCAVLRTSNDVEKTNVLFTVPFTLMKDYRWIDLGDGTDAMVARGWLEEPGVSEDGNTIIEQSYALEFFAETNSGSTRLMVLWAETTFKTVDYEDDLIAGTTRYGIDTMFDACEDWLDTN